MTPSAEGSEIHQSLSTWMECSKNQMTSGFRILRVSSSDATPKPSLGWHPRPSDTLKSLHTMFSVKDGMGVSLRKKHTSDTDSSDSDSHVSHPMQRAPQRETRVPSDPIRRTPFGAWSFQVVFGFRATPRQTRDRFDLGICSGAGGGWISHSDCAFRELWSINIT